MGYRLSKIYTRTGDDGYTQTGPGARLSKDSACIEALGTLDELNCAIGLSLAHGITHKELSECLTQVQQDLFNVGGELCAPHFTAITAEKVTALENWIDLWNANLPPLTEFVLPRGSLTSTSCHLARAICRRAERCLVRLFQEQEFNVKILHYVNRLSDLLFVAARLLAQETSQTEVLWDHQKSKPSG